jgi:hypothetical protein
MDDRETRRRIHELLISNAPYEYASLKCSVLADRNQKVHKGTLDPFSLEL